MIDKYFYSNKSEECKEISKMLFELDNYVKNYVSNEKSVLLEGKINDYNRFIKNKSLSYFSKDSSDVLKSFSKLFQRAVIWENPGTMINITPPANIISLVTSFYASLYNPNFAQDESSGYLMTTELLVIKYLSEIVGWNAKKSGGVFTFGGKGTNLYGVKIGLKKAFPDIIENGIGGRKAVVISNEKGHPCHKEVCDWLGLGKSSCIRLKTNESGQIDIDDMEECMRTQIENNNKIACIILNGGTTNEIIIDPIKKVVDLRNRLVKEYKLNYIPHIHVDAVIGWAWLFFKKYDFKNNKFNMSKQELKKIKSMKNKIAQIKYADSFGADFHKTGFCPYISSVYLSKDFNDVTILGNKKYKGIDKLLFGEYSPFEYTLELTRSSIGPVSAYIALETFGIEGFQELIYKLFSNGEYIRTKINSINGFEVINLDTEGIATLFVVHKDYEKKYIDYLNLSEEKIKAFLDYNYKFYLYSLKMLEEKKVDFKITFSKSYKSYGSNIKTGALKIYPTSPIVNKEELDNIMLQLKNLKQDFDKYTKELNDTRDFPIDYVYRD